MARKPANGSDGAGGGSQLTADDIGSLARDGGGSAEGSLIDGLAVVGADFGSSGSGGGDSGTAGGGTDDSTGPRRRGRKPGSRNASSTARKKVPPSLEGIEALLMSVHMMGATVLKNEAIALDHKEAAALAGAIQNVSRHYDTGLSEKTMDWANLSIIVVGIYGQRIMSLKRPRKMNGAHPPQSEMTDRPMPPLTAFDLQ